MRHDRRKQEADGSQGSEVPNRLVGGTCPCTRTTNCWGCLGFFVVVVVVLRFACCSFLGRVFVLSCSHVMVLLIRLVLICFPHHIRFLLLLICYYLFAFVFSLFRWMCMSRLSYTVQWHGIALSTLLGMIIRAYLNSHQRAWERMERNEAARGHSFPSYIKNWFGSTKRPRQPNRHERYLLHLPRPIGVHIHLRWCPYTSNNLLFVPVRSGRSVLPNKKKGCNTSSYYGGP